MYLKHLKLTNFKNIASFEHDLSRINCFVGNNGVGKTNILDSIYYLSFCKSYFTQSDNQSVKRGEKFFSIVGTCCANNSTEEYICAMELDGKKTFRHSGKAYTRHSDHIGKMPSVIITPNDHALVEGGSELRRRFIDLTISQQDSAYLKELINYNKVLSQRNRMLKDRKSGGFFDEMTLQIADEQLSYYSDILQAKRREFFSDFAEPFSRFYSLIGSKTEDVRLEYRTYEGGLLELLRQNRERDFVLGCTTCGVHRDDLAFLLERRPIKTYGSQGQQKTFLLALKLAQFDYLAKKLSQTPILMIDDIFDKLDFERVNALLRLIGSDSFGQIFITDTHLDRIETLIGEDLKSETKIFKL